MNRLRDLPSIAKVLILIGAVMFVFGVVRAALPHTASAGSDSYTQTCGSVLAPKKTVSTINCNRGGNAAIDLTLVLGGIIVATGGATMWEAKPA